MRKNEKAEQRTMDHDAGKTEETESEDLHPQSIRLAGEDWKSLEEMARLERRMTGGTATASSIARQILRQEIRRRSGSATQTIVIS